MTRPVTASGNPSPLGRRAASRLLGGGLVVLALSACGLKPKEYGPGEKPFWEIERQED